jgi:protein phosphatase
MISTQQIIYCPNPACTNPINPVGDSFCTNCQTPLVYRYVWATGSENAKIRSGTKVADRYEVISPQIWLDTHPGLLPDVPEELPPEIASYLHLYPQRLHLPIVYGYTHLRQENPKILLLENVPIDNHGELYPAIASSWEQATAVRQVYWLWQILQLWKTLSEHSVAGSLLIADNLRVQGWCVRLVELRVGQATLEELGHCWQSWVALAKPTVVELQQIVQQMCDGAAIEIVDTQLNELLLSASAELPLSIKVAGATDVGSQLSQNEDACYPTTADSIDDPLLEQVAIICDGIGGHEGGEVASQLALQSVKLQVRALLAELKLAAEVVHPQLLRSQLAASLRVVNNLIWNCNNEQKREGTQRMGTTIVMALQLPQKVHNHTTENAHEVYLVNVGDSRAYWITSDYCQLLTVDDDIVTREVRSARSVYRKALSRLDATALTQALGTKDGEHLRPEIQRLILEEDGILLLCSDGLSDGNLVEHYWRDYAVPVLRGEVSLEESLYFWIDLANQKNGQDNISVVLTHYRVSSPSFNSLANTPVLAVQTLAPEVLQPEEDLLTDSARALWDIDVETQEVPVTATVSSVKHKSKIMVLGLLLLLIAGTSIGLFAWWYSPQSFKQTCQKLPTIVQQLCSITK